MSRTLNILGIAPYEGMETIMKHLSEKRDDFFLTTYTGDLDEGVRIVQQIAADDYDAIISRGGTAQMIQAVTPIPVIEVALSVYDILRAIKLAENYANRYAIVGFSGITKPAQLLCDLLRYEIDIYTIVNIDDVSFVLSDLKTKGYHMVLSDMVTYTHAKALGLHAILITSGEETIEMAFDQAVKLCASYAGIREKNKLLAEALKSHPSQVVIMEDDGNIFFSSFDNNNEKEAVHNYLKNVRRQSRSVKTEKSFQAIQEKMYVVTATPMNIGDDKLTIFYLEENPVPALTSKNGLRYTTQEEIRIQLSHSFYQTIPHNMQPVFQQVNELQQPILIEGESGTCKTDVACLLYIHSTYKNNPLIIIDCALLNDKNWKFLINHYNSPFCDSNNTIYISHLNELPEAKRKQMLSVMIDMNVCTRNRILLSWTRSPGQNAIPEAREFINNLSCITLSLPPLREHTQEIASIASLYINTLNMELSKQIIGFVPEALELLCGYQWPSNYIQLKRILTELAVRTKAPYIDAQTTAEILRKETDDQYAYPSHGGLTASFDDPAKTQISLNKPLNEITRDIIQNVLDKCDGNQSKAAKQLGISRSTLWRYLK